MGQSPYKQGSLQVLCLQLIFCKEGACCQRPCGAPFPPASPREQAEAWFRSLQCEDNFQVSQRSQLPVSQVLAGVLQIYTEIQFPRIRIPPTSSKVDNRQIYKMKCNLEKEPALPFVANFICISGEVRKSGVRGNRWKA